MLEVSFFFPKAQLRDMPRQSSSSRIDFMSTKTKRLYTQMKTQNLRWGVFTSGQYGILGDSGSYLLLFRFLCYDFPELNEKRRD